MRPRRSDWLIALIALILFAVVARISTLERGLTVSVVFSLFTLIIHTKWETRKDSLKEWRFWGVLGVFAVIHVVVLSLVEIPPLKHGMIIMPFALADGLAMWHLINWVERRFPAQGSVQSSGGN